MNFLDLLIITGLVLALIRGYRKGVLVSFFKLMGYLIGLVTAVLFGEVLAKVLDKSFGITEQLSPWLGDKASLPAAVQKTQIKDIPFDKAQDLVATIPMPETFQNTFLDYLNEIAFLPEKGIHNLGDGLMHLLSNFLLTGICFTLLFFLVSRFMGVTIPKWFKKATPGPVSFVDHLGGAALGLVSGFISIGITVAMLIPVAAVGAIQEPGQRGIIPRVAALFQESTLATAISDIVIKFIS